MRDNKLETTYPLVSIAVCTYNGERYLAKQLDSILAQTYTNIEVIMVDDCSTDGTLEIIETAKKLDPRIKYTINDVNLGYNKNFEKAIKLCRGEYIAISDQDDIWLPYKIEHLLGCMKGKQMIYGNSAFIDEDDRLTGRLIINPERDPSLFGCYKNILLENFVTGHNILFKRTALDFILPFPERGFYDWWMGFVMLYENQLGFCNEVVTHYRVHETSVINRLTQDAQKSLKTKQLKYCLINLEVLDSFKTYKNLTKQDSSFIHSLYNALKVKTSSYYSISLFMFLFRHFKQLFPGYQKGNLKSLAYIYRYSRGIRLSALFRK